MNGASFHGDMSPVCSVSQSLQVRFGRKAAFSWATISTVAGKPSLLPVWSPCVCVLYPRAARDQRRKDQPPFHIERSFRGRELRTRTASVADQLAFAVARAHSGCFWRKEISMAKAKSPIPEGFRTITPQLVFDNAAEAIDWCKKALGATEVSRAVGPDGKIMHADLKIGDSRFMLNDPMGGSKGPKALGGSPASIWLYVDDCDSLFNRAVAAGGQVTMPLADQFWGDRCGAVKDPHGYTWNIATHKEDLTKEEMDKRAADFFKQFAGQAH
jgi:PhnB protein